jgi:hypothetical protein
MSFSRSTYRSSYARRYDSSGPKEIIDLDVTLDALDPLPKATPQNRGQEQYLDSEEGGYFYDGMTRANYRDKLRDYKLSSGPAALLARMQDSISLRSKATRIERENFKRDGGRVGSAYEYERFKRGATTEARFYERRKRVERQHRGTIVIHSTSSMHSGESALTMEWTGAAAMSLVEMLEGIGYNCVVRVVNGNAGNDKEIQLAVTVKQEGERMSEHALAFMCNGGYNRFMMFRLWCSTAATMQLGLGAVNPYTGSLTADITIPHNVRSEASAEAFIHETMKRYDNSDLDQDERHAEDRERNAESTSAWGFDDSFGRDR